MKCKYRIFDICKYITMSLGIIIAILLPWQLVWKAVLLDYKLLGILYFILVIGLIVCGNLWKQIDTILFTMFLVWLAIGDLIGGDDALSAFGGRQMRMWLICFALFLLGMVINDNIGKLHILAMLTLHNVSCMFAFIIFIKNAITNLLTLEFKVGMRWGLIKNGRLHAMGNANTIAIIAAVIVLSFPWVVIATRKIKYRKLIVLVNVICALVGLLILSLARSRGSILSVAIGLGCGAAVYSWNKLKKDVWWRKVFVCCISMVGVIVCSVLIIYMPKRIFDKEMIKLAQSRLNEEEVTLVKEQLTPYGVDYALETLSDRTMIWPATINMMNDEPRYWITGITTARIGTLPIYGVYEGRPELVASYPHSGYVGMLFLYGVPGTCLLGFLFLRWIWNSINICLDTEGDLCKKLLVMFVVMPFAWGIVEVAPYPYTCLYSTVMMFFLSAGVISRKDEK